MRRFRLTDYDIAMVVSGHVFEAILVAMMDRPSGEQIEMANKLAKIARDLTPETLKRKYPHHEVPLETQTS